MDTDVSLFLPHAVIGLVSALGIAAGILTGHDAPQIIIWAVINATIMYGFILSVLLPAYGRKIQSLCTGIARRLRFLSQGHPFTIRPLYDPRT